MTEPEAIASGLKSDTGPVTNAHTSRVSERRRIRRMRAPERRTGFDRRGRYPVTGTLRDSPATLIVMLVAINMLSALDFALTRVQLKAGTATEGNPILASMFEQGVGQAWLFKTTVVLAVTFAVWHQRKYRAILNVAVGALIVYILVIAYHVAGILWLTGAA